MVRLVACCVVALVGCYEPKLQECAVRCMNEVDCAPGQACRADGWCATPSFVDSCEPGAVEGSVGTIHETLVDAGVDDASADATIAVDAAIPVDAKICAPGCSGTCDDGVCVIACIANTSCPNEVLCPAIGPCRVWCAGRKSCEKGVRCGLGKCTVTCSGEESCKRRVRCGDACACDVTCSGDEACDEEASCPKPWCEAGGGCTSAPNGCNAC